VIELPTFDFNIRQHNNNNNGGDAASQMLELNGGLFNIPRNLNRTSAPRCPSTADDCRSIKNPVALLGFAREKKSGANVRSAIGIARFIKKSTTASST